MATEENNAFMQHLAEQDRKWQERQRDKHLHDVYGSRCTIWEWEKHIDDESGAIYYANPETGEVKEYYRTEVEVGTRIIPPDEQKRMKAAREKRLEREMIQKMTHSGEKAEQFVFIDANINFRGVSPAMVTRLLYLSTYAGYKNKHPKGFGNPLIKRGVHLQKKDIAEVLQLSERTAASFLKEVCPTYIKEDANGYLYLNSRSFVRGGLKKRDFKQYQKIYNNGIRKLYEAAKGKNHKQLGHVFMMIPFINIKYNILCHNPGETDVDKVIPMSPKEFCKEVGYSYSNLNRLMNIYSSVTFDVEGRKEHLCKIVGDWNDQPNAKICINPAVIYAGTPGKRLEISKLYFSERTEKPDDLTK